MGCITACFGSSKKHQRSSRVRTNSPQQSLIDGDAVKEALSSTHQRLAEEAQIAAISAIKLESREKIDEDELNVSTRKKVTFDLDVKIQEKGPNFSVGDVINCLSEKGGNEGVGDEGDLVSDSTVSSLFSYPHDLRYKNCCTSSDGDNESVDMEFKDDGMESENKEKNGCENSTAVPVQEESSESLFSLSIDSRKKNSVVDYDVGEKEVSSPLKPPSTNRGARERSNHVQSVLKPIENLSQRKDVVRSKTTPLVMIPKEKENMELEKENDASGFHEEPGFLKNGGEVAVDASLSSWLKGSGKDLSITNSPDSVANSSSSKLQRANSTPNSLANRPILGALTVNELKQVPKGSSSSPERSRGSYWRHTSEAIVGTDCKKASSMNSTPCQTKLNRGV